MICGAYLTKVSETGEQNTERAKLPKKCNLKKLSLFFAFSFYIFSPLKRQKERWDLFFNISSYLLKFLLHKYMRCTKIKNNNNFWKQLEPSRKWYPNLTQSPNPNFATRLHVAEKFRWGICWAKGRIRINDCSFRIDCLSIYLRASKMSKFV